MYRRDTTFSVLAFTKYCTETPLAHSLFPKMKVDFKKQNVRTFEDFMSPRDSPRLIFCVLWRNYAYRTQDACLKKSLGMTRPGIEPATSRSQSGRSTTEPLCRYYSSFEKSALCGANH